MTAEGIFRSADDRAAIAERATRLAKALTVEVNASLTEAAMLAGKLTMTEADGGKTTIARPPADAISACSIAYSLALADFLSSAPTGDFAGQAFAQLVEDSFVDLAGRRGPAFAIEARERLIRHLQAGSARGAAARLNSIIQCNEERPANDPKKVN